MRKDRSTAKEWVLVTVCLLGAMAFGVIVAFVWLHATGVI